MTDSGRWWRSCWSLWAVRRIRWRRPLCSAVLLTGPAGEEGDLELGGGRRVSVLSAGSRALGRHDRSGTLRRAFSHKVTGGLGLGRRGGIGAAANDGRHECECSEEVDRGAARSTRRGASVLYRHVPFGYRCDRPRCVSCRQATSDESERDGEPLARVRAGTASRELGGRVGPMTQAPPGRRT